MGDEDWDTELTSTPSFTSDFSKLKTENSFTTNEGSGFRGGNDVNKSDAPSRGGLGAGRGFGFQRGNRSEGDSSAFGNRSNGGSSAFGNRSDGGSTFGNRSRGALFGRGGFKGKSEDAASDSGFGDNGPRRNGSFSKRGGFGDGNVDDDLKDRSANKGFSHSEDRFGERRGRGAGRGGRGGYGRSSGDGNVDELGNESGETGFDHSEDGFGERRGRGAFRGTRGGFGRRFENGDEQSQSDSGTRGRLGSPSSFEGRGRGGGFGGRGGFKGRNEDVGSDSGQAADGCAWKADEEESGDKPARVTYVPPPPPDTEDGIFAHYQTGINFDKYDDIPVQVSGLEPPPAILTFEEANLPETLNSNISKAGYMKLTPVQKYGIPIVLAGRDLMACAQTGSGKTAAFLLPILAHMLQDGIAARSSEPQEPEAIIIAPTRELINQIFLDARKFAYGTCVRPVVVYGGMQPIHAIRQIYQGCNILCATPGRLLDIIKREKIGLTKLRYLVLDEADRMLDMGFGPDMKALISSPGMPTKDQRQTLMYSATFPEDIQSMAREFLKSNYLFVAVGQVGGACSDVEQQVLEVGQYDKKNTLIGILQELGKERTMVFVETKKKADFLTTMLCQEKVSATSIHGDRLQREREEALADFRLGKCNVLVATNVAARGLDIENVQHVINFDLSKNVDEYVHRIGRTGRCGNTGRAITFFDTTEDRDLARPLVKVLSDAQQEVPAWLEEIAFSSHGSYSSRGSTFASVDTRKDFSTKGPVQSAFAANDDDASWD